MRLQGRLFLYFLAGAVVVTVLSVGIFLTISPEAAGSDDATELTSPGGRIRVDQVLSYTDPRKTKGTAHDLETEVPTAVYVPSYLPDGFRHSHTRLITKTSVGQLFEGANNTTLMVVQSPSVTQTARPGFVESIDANGVDGEDGARGKLAVSTVPAGIKLHDRAWTMRSEPLVLVDVRY